MGRFHSLKDGVILEESRLGSGESDSEYFLMPGLMDAHAHLTTTYQMEQMVRNGVTTVCDVSASEELQNSYAALNVWSAHSSIRMGHWKSMRIKDLK